MVSGGKKKRYTARFLGKGKETRRGSELPGERKRLRTQEIDVQETEKTNPNVNRKKREGEKRGT